MIEAKTISRTPYVSSNLVRSLEHWAVLHSMITGFADEATCPFRAGSLQMSWFSTSFTDGVSIIQRIRDRRLCLNWTFLLLLEPPLLILVPSTIVSRCLLTLTTILLRIHPLIWLHAKSLLRVWRERSSKPRWRHSTRHESIRSLRWKGVTLHLGEIWWELLILLLLSIPSTTITSTTTSPTVSHDQNLLLLEVFNTQHHQARTIRREWRRRSEGGEVNPRIPPFCTRTALP
jgi:hypothetical protein